MKLTDIFCLDRRSKEKICAAVYILCGLILGCIPQFFFKPLLYSLLYKSPLEIAATLILFSATITIPFIILVKQDFTHHFSARKRVQLLLFGISTISFLAAGYNFLTYPSALLSEDAGWIIGKGGWDAAFTVSEGKAIRFSQIVLFIGKTLWSLFIGSISVTIDRLFSIIESLKPSKQTKKHLAPTYKTTSEKF